MKPIVLCIMDGIGYRKEQHGNAVLAANTPTLDLLWDKYPHSLLEASGEQVGLPSGQMGNSEVGHGNIGAGRIVYQPLELINKSIKEKTFFENKQILEVINHSKNNNSKLHILGLLSDGGVHSHIDQLFSIIDMCKMNNVEEVYFHIFLDGRDTSQDSGLLYLEQLENKIAESKIGKIATISGRYYAMDRDNRWDRVEKAYDVIVNGNGEIIPNYKEHIKENYSNNILDEFINPFIVNEEGLISENDGLIVFNYRPDRLRELFKAISNKDFIDFPTKKFNNIKLVTMFHVSDELISLTAFNHQSLDNMFGPYISSLGLKQLRIAETEKYAHVTYFFDGGKELELPGKDQILVSSPKVATYDLDPEMSAYEVTDKLLDAIDKNIYDVIILNLANGDMVGHTGSIPATIKAVETVDKCVGRIFDKVSLSNGLLILTADHGNSDYMLDDNERVVTSHSTSKVPFIITDSKYTLKDGKLADIAPTMLSILGLKIPTEMDGNVLVEFKKKNKKVSKKNNIFIILSLIFILSLITIYGYRFIKYYKEENPTNNAVTSNYLSTKIIKEEVVAKGSGLYLENSEYVFKGNVSNNYVYYSGRLFRIVKVNKDQTIKLITDDSVSSLVWGIDNNYETSYVRKYLNSTEEEYSGIFYNSLIDPDLYLESKDFCIDKVEGKTTCKKTVKEKVGLLTYAEYKDALGYESYLNTGKYWWLINPSTTSPWYVFDKGGVNDEGNNASTYYSYGVRPVINLKANLDYISGTGTKEDPYIINNDSTVSVGDYVKYSNYTWKIIEVNDTSVKLAMNNYLTISNKEVTRAFSTSANKYNVKDTSSLAYYLNNTFYKSLTNNTLVENGTWYTGSYNEDTKYDYTKIYDTNVLSKVGLMNVTDLYTTDLSEYYLFTPSNEDMVYSIKADSTIYSSLMENKLKVRPVIYVNKNLTVGTGTISDPYIVG